MKNGLKVSIVDDRLFRKALCVTAQYGSQAITHSKEGHYDTTVQHRTHFTTKLIPDTDERLDREMQGMKGRIEKLSCTIMSDEWQSTSNRPIVDVVLGTNGMLTLRSATDRTGHDKTMEYMFSLVDVDNLAWFA